ncbi:metallophosphoesterase [Streptomyces sp. NPDC091377]|uniref:metallophosphoesterase n=1 Tax=Streptomyces sp. NPDC091377 TaxID=3365995 RepID=UPI0037FAD5A5
MRIVHISDLHARDDWGNDQRKVLRAFLTDVADFHARTPVDCVVFSGDLAYGGKPDQFALAQQRLLDPLQERLGLDRERMILAPGNHDVDISRIDDFQEVGLRGRLTDRDQVNALLDRPDLANYLDRLAPWQEFTEGYYAGTAVERISPLVTLHRFTAGGTEVVAAGLTSCWRATGAGDDADRAHLIVGDRQMTDAVDRLGSAALKIGVMHHPLDWLAEFDRGDVGRELAHFDMLFTGHVHVVDPLAVAGKTGSLMQSAAGSLFQWRDYLNAYSVIDVRSTTAPRAYTVHVRSYFDGRDAFAEGVNVVSGGRLEIDFAQPGRGGTATQADPNAPAASPQNPGPAGAAPAGTPVDAPLDAPTGTPADPPATDPLAADPPVTRTSSDLAADALIDAVRERSLILGPGRENQPMDGLLVPPVLLRLPVDQYMALHDLDEGRIGVDEMIGSLAEHHHFLIVGDEYAGLTSTLQWLVHTAYVSDAQYVPVVIDFAAVETGPSGVEKEVRRQLAGAGIALGRKDELPRLALAVDNVDPGSEKRLRHLLKFLTHHPQTLSFLGCRTTARHRVADAMTGVGCPARVRHIGPFGRRELRALVRLLRPEESEGDIDAMLDLLTRGRLPRTPVMLAALLSTAGHQDWTAGVNSTAILESYLGLLLGRDDPSVDRRFELDFVALRDILACVNEHLMLTGKDSLPRMEAEEFLLNYFKGLGWSEPSGAVLDALIAKRILTERDQVIHFCQPMVRPLLAAYRMAESEELKELVLAGPLQHTQVIRHTAALRRNDAELLRITADGFRALRERLGDGGSDPFSVLATENGWHTDEEAQSVLDDLFPADLPYDSAGPPTEVPGDFRVMMDDLQDQADAMQTLALDQRQGPGFSPTEFEAYVEALDLLADVLRSSELVRDLDLKRTTLRLCLNGYGVRAALMAAEWGNRDGRSVFRESLSEVLERQEISEAEFEEFMGRVELYSPVLSSYWALSQVLASGKLSRLTGEALGEGDFIEQPGQALMAVLLMRHMGDREWVRHATAVVKRHGEREVIGEILRLFAQSNYYGQPDLSKAELGAHELLLFEIAVHRSEFVSPAGPGRDWERNRWVKRMRDRRLQYLQRGENLAIGPTPMPS